MASSQLEELRKKVASGEVKTATQNMANYKPSGTTITGNPVVNNTPQEQKIQPIETQTNSLNQVYNPIDDINRLKEAQIQNKVAELTNIRNNQLSNLDAEQREIAPKYRNDRLDVNTKSQMGARNFAEFLAQRGLSSSGISAQAEISRIGRYQNDINNLNIAENKANEDILRRRTLAQNDYDTGVAGAKGLIDAQAMQNIIDANRYIDETTYKRGQDTLNRSDNIATSLGYVPNPTGNINVSQVDRNALQPYMSDLDAFIRANPNSPLVNSAIALRNEKIYGNLGQYGQYAQKSMDGLNNDLAYKTSQYQYDELTNPESVTNRLKVLQLESAELDNKIKQVEADFTLSPQYKQYLLDELKHKQQMFALEIRQANASIANIYSTIADRNKPKVKEPTQTQITNQKFGEDYNTLKGKSVNDAINILIKEKGDLIGTYGPEGYKKLWDTTLSDAIRVGQALPYDSYFSQGAGVEEPIEEKQGFFKKLFN